MQPECCLCVSICLYSEAQSSQQHLKASLCRSRTCVCSFSVIWDHGGQRRTVGRGFVCRLQGRRSHHQGDASLYNIFNGSEWFVLVWASEDRGQSVWWGCNAVQPVGSNVCEPSDLQKPAGHTDTLHTLTVCTGTEKSVELQNTQFNRFYVTEQGVYSYTDTESHF